MPILFYIIAGFILFIMLRLTDKVLHSEIITEKIHPVFLRIFPVIEFMLWFLYLLWALSGLFYQWDFYNILMYSVIIAIIAGLSWFIAKDFIAGIVLKTEFPFHINQYIILPQTEGKLKKLGFRSLEIENDNGQIIKIPYSRLTNEIITSQSNTDGLKGYETRITLKKEIKENDASEMIKKELMLLPWTLPIKKPSVRIVTEEESKNICHVKYFAMNQEHAENISRHLKNAFSDG